MRKLSALTVSLVLLAGCGSNPTITIPTDNIQTVVAVMLTRAPSRVEAGASFTLNATVLNSANQNVSWHVNGKPGGDDSSGRILAGAYSAPASVTAPLSVTISVIAEADATKSASVNLTVWPATTLKLGPIPTTIVAGGKYRFTAQLSDGAVPELTWGAWGGTITADGEFTAASLAGIAYVSVFTPNVVPGKAQTITIPVIPSSALLNGRYVFSYDGVNVGGHIAMAGMFTADGTGAISAGILDAVSPSAVLRDVAFDGSYTVGTDGRGTMTVHVAGQDRTWRIAATGDSVLFAELEGATIGAGIMEPQSSSRGRPDNESTWLLSSSPSPRGPALAGMFERDALGAIAGEYDVRRISVPAVHDAFTGTYILDATGRGLKDSSISREFRLYQVSGQRMYAVSLDPALDTVWRANQDYKVPFINGEYGIGAAGLASTGPIAQAGTVSLYAGSFTSGGFDENRSGAVRTFTVQGGAYNSGAGRSEVQLDTSGGARSLVMYAANVQGVFLIADNDVQLAGELQTDSSCQSGQSYLLAAGNGSANDLAIAYRPGVAAGEDMSFDLLQQGTLLLDQSITAAFGMPEFSHRQLVSFGPPLSRSYALYGCRMVSLDPAAPGVGLLTGAVTIPPPPDNPWGPLF